MPAYAKLSLVTPVFHPSDVAFVRSWSAAAPGLGGWRVAFDRDDAPEQVLVLPPGADEPVFVLVRDTRDVVLLRRRPGAPNALSEVHRFDNLRNAVLTLCRISDDALEEIHERLELEFPRHGR